MAHSLLNISATVSDLGSQNDINFTWSSVTAATHCPAVNYNILASNCGSCPTTTNYTNAICTDVLNDRLSVVCKFAVQPIVCNNTVINNLSEVIQLQVVLRNSFRNSTSLGAIITTFILIALVLTVLTAASMTAAIYCARERKKIQRELEQHDGDYECVRNQQQKTTNTIDTTTNVAYHNRISLQK